MATDQAQEKKEAVVLDPMSEERMFNAAVQIAVLGEVEAGRRCCSNARLTGAFCGFFFILTTTCGVLWYVTVQSGTSAEQLNAGYTTILAVMLSILASAACVSCVVGYVLCMQEYRARRAIGQA